MGIYASDIESTGLLHMMMKQENPKLHNLCSIDMHSSEMMLFEGHQRKEIQAWLDEGHTFVMHYGSLFDFEALKFLGYDTSKTKLIDSLALSWYLEPNRVIHGLEQYGAEFGVKKPPITDWENQTQEEYNNRVIEDCKIQKRLWHKQVARLQELYGEDEGAFDRLIAFLMHKMEELRQQQKNKWTLDVPAAEVLHNKLEGEIAEKTDALRLVMPKNPIYKVRKRPAKPFKKSGELSSTGERWKALTERLNLPFEHAEDIKEVVDYEVGNPASHTQMKAWLDSLGWEPMTFKFVKGDEKTGSSDRNIPQINLKGGEICESVKELIEKEPGIEHIAGLGILNHRFGVVKGFLRDAIDGELVAGAAGFTNTLRLQHREIVNLPSARVKYGEDLRGCLVARPGKKLLGSDLSSLEDRLKHHFQWSLDRKYVMSQMADDFDPHLLIASIAGLLDDDQVAFYKWMKAKCPDEYPIPLTYYRNLSEEDRKKEFKRIDEVRAVGKSTNYACQYGAGVATIARTAKCTNAVAKKLHAAYHKMNWSIAKIATMMKVKKTSFGQWQWNPISKYWYSLRSDKDRFSTLIQGSGAYVLDLWIYHCERLAKKRGLEWTLLGQFHDELIIEFPDGEDDVYKELVSDGLQCVNDALKLNRELACGIDFGYKYSEIH